MKETTDLRFGILPVRESFAFEGGTVVPVQGSEEVIAHYSSRIDKEGYLQPPLRAGRKGQLHDKDTADAVWNAPASSLNIAQEIMRRVEATHELHLAAPRSDGNPRRGEGAFMMHALGYALGYRLQFEHWWLVGRVYFKGRNNAYVKRDRVAAFLSAAYRFWRSLGEGDRRRVTNLLYLHLLADSYRWDWERFTVEYMVLDACYETARASAQLPRRVPHAKRIGALLDTFGMARDETAEKELVDIRNNLFHEALWAGGMPGEARTNGWVQTLRLHALNDRLIMGLIGFKSDLTKLHWSNFLGQVRF